MSDPVSGTFTSATSSSGLIIRLAKPAAYNVSIKGTFVGTVDVERSFDGGSTWWVVESFTAPVERIGDSAEGHEIVRLTCSAYTSGTVTYRIGLGD